MEIRHIKYIQDDLNDYIDNSQETDFVENEFIYDDIDGLEEMLLDVSRHLFEYYYYSKHKWNSF